MQSPQQVLEAIKGLPVIAAVRESLGEVRGRAYLINDALRDLFFGLPPLSYHFVLGGDAAEAARRLAGRVPGHVSVRETEWGAVARYYGELGEIYLLPSKGLGIGECMKRHADFTVNSLAYDIAGGELLEFHDAVSDIRSRTVRLVSPLGATSADHLLRAVSLAVRIPNYAISPQTSQDIKANSDLLAKASPQSVGYELSKILDAKEYLEGVSLLGELRLLPGIFKFFLPGLMPSDRGADGDEGRPYPVARFTTMGRTVDELVADDEFLRKNFYLLRQVVLLTPWLRRDLLSEPPEAVSAFLKSKGERLERELFRITAPPVHVFRVRVVAVGYLLGVARFGGHSGGLEGIGETVEQAISTFGAWKGLLSSVLICADSLTAGGRIKPSRRALEGAAEIMRARAEVLARARQSYAHAGGWPGQNAGPGAARPGPVGFAS